MDYLTKPVSRKELREYAVVFRKLFGIQQHGRVPVMDVLEKFHLVFPGSFFSIAEDTDLPATLPARCNVLGNGKFEIEIRQTTYDGAYRNIGAYRITSSMKYVMHSYTLLATHRSCNEVLKMVEL